MTKIGNKILLAGDKFMPEMHLKQSGFTSSSYRPFTRNKEGIQKFKETGDSIYIYKNELGKTCFQHDMAYRDFKDLAKITASDKFLRDNAFNIAKNPKYDEYQEVLLLWFINVLINKTCGSGANNKIKQNQQLAVELHKPTIRKFKKKKSLFFI